MVERTSQLSGKRNPKLFSVLLIGFGVHAFAKPCSRLGSAFMCHGLSYGSRTVVCRRHYFRRLFRMARIQSLRRGKKILRLIRIAERAASKTERISAAGTRLTVVSTATYRTRLPGSMTNTDGFAMPPLSLAFSRSHSLITCRSMSHNTGNGSESCARKASDCCAVSTETAAMLAPAARI